jgi:hypothetical protein
MWCSCGGKIATETISEWGTLAGGHGGTCESKCTQCKKVHNYWDF